MIDDEDVNFVALASLLSPGWGSVWLALLLVVLVAYCNNVEECSHKSCPIGLTPKLMKHECLCVTVAR